MPLGRHVEAELLERDPDRVDAALLAEHDAAFGADDVRGVRLDRRRVVELGRDGARLPREERLARDRLPRRERLFCSLLRRAARERAPASGRAVWGYLESASSARATSKRSASPCLLPHAVHEALHPGRARLHGGDRGRRPRARSRRARASAPGCNRAGRGARETRNAAASGVAIPSVSTTTTSARPGLDRRLVGAVGRSRGRRGRSRRRRRRRDPLPVSNLSSAMYLLEHRLAR